MTRLRSLATALTLLLAAPPLGAAPRGRLEAPTEARERFAWGLKLFQEGDHAGALAELRRVYELYPTAAVLLKIGLVYAAMGRSVEATDTLDRALPGAGLDAEDIAAGRAEREVQARRIARLSVTSNVPATIDVDGIEAGHTPLPQPLRVVSGARVVGALAPGYLPSRREVTVAGGGEAALHFDLAPSEAKAAHLWVRSQLPAADVLIDGQRVARTPVPSSLTVAPGKHEVELRRPGYRADRRGIEIGDGAVADLSFDLRPDPGAPPAGRVRLAISEPGAEVTIDGRPASSPPAAGLPLPAGEHNLRVERGGFRVLDRVLVAPEGGEAVVNVTLQPTEATRQSYEAGVRTRRRIGNGLAIGGAAIAVAAGALWLYERGIVNDAEGPIAAWTTGGCSQLQRPPMCDQLEGPAHDAESRRDSAQGRQDVASVAAGVGLVAAAAGLVVLFTAGNPHRYEQAASIAVVPAAGGGGLAFGGRF